MVRRAAWIVRWTFNDTKSQSSLARAAQNLIVSPKRLVVDICVGYDPISAAPLSIGLICFTRHVFPVTAATIVGLTPAVSSSKSPIGIVPVPLGSA